MDDRFSIRKPSSDPLRAALSRFNLTKDPLTLTVGSTPIQITPENDAPANLAITEHLKHLITHRLRFPDPEFDAHYSDKTVVDCFERICNAFELQNIKGIEIGVGKGVMTKAILNTGIKPLLGFEIDKNVKPEISGPGVSIIYENIFKTGEKYFSEPFVLVGNPPYNILREISKLSCHPNCIGYILVSSIPKSLLFPDAHILCQISGAEFTPPAAGNHVIMAGGKNIETLIKQNAEIHLPRNNIYVESTSPHK